MDYALRIMHCLAENGASPTGTNAGSVSDATSVPQRFTLKILHKLAQSGLVKSYKGAGGGYALSKTPAEIDLLTIIESIDGPVSINQCLDEGCECSRTNFDKNKCFYHRVLDDINETISAKLRSVTLEDAISQGQRKKSI